MFSRRRFCVASLANYAAASNNNNNNANGIRYLTSGPSNGQAVDKRHDSRRRRPEEG